MSYIPEKGMPYYLRMKISLFYSGWHGRHKGIYRTIDILPTATFDDLHDIIYDLYDRYDEHLWEFIFHRTSPWNRNAYRLLSWEDEFGMEPDRVGRAWEYTLADFGIGPGSAFFYHFDMGDDWIHKIVVSSYQKPKDPERLYVLVKSQGKSPAQYPEFDEDGNIIEDDEDDDE